MTQNAIQQRALRTLKQKRMYENQLAQLVQQTFNMESAALVTENLRNTMATVGAMQQANKELKKQYGKIDIDKIEVRASNTVNLTPTLNEELYRISTLRWRIYWNRPTRFKSRSGDLMLFPTSWTKQTSKPVNPRQSLRSYRPLI
jgi:hypothetical protein